MPAQVTTRAQVNGYRFLIRRLEHALIRGDSRMIHDPMRGQMRALIVGLVIAVAHHRRLRRAGVLQAVTQPRRRTDPAEQVQRCGVRADRRPRAPGAEPGLGPADRRQERKPQGSRRQVSQRATARPDGRHRRRADEHPRRGRHRDVVVDGVRHPCRHPASPRPPARQPADHRAGQRSGARRRHPCRRPRAGDPHRGRAARPISSTTASARRSTCRIWWWSTDFTCRARRCGRCRWGCSMRSRWSIRSRRWPSTGWGSRARWSGRTTRSARSSRPSTPAVSSSTSCCATACSRSRRPPPTSSGTANRTPSVPRRVRSPPPSWPDAPIVHRLPVDHYPTVSPQIVPTDPDRVACMGWQRSNTAAQADIRLLVGHRLPVPGGAQSVRLANADGNGPGLDFGVLDSGRR